MATVARQALPKLAEHGAQPLAEPVRHDDVVSLLKANPQVLAHVQQFVVGLLSAGDESLPAFSQAQAHADAERLLMFERRGAALCETSARILFHADAAAILARQLETQMAEAGCRTREEVSTIAGSAPQTPAPETAVSELLSSPRSASATTRKAGTPRRFAPADKAAPKTPARSPAATATAAGRRAATPSQEEKASRRTSGQRAQQPASPSTAQPALTPSAPAVPPPTAAEPQMNGTLLVAVPVLEAAPVLSVLAQDSPIVDLAAINELLPFERTSDQQEKRKVLFRSIDCNGNGFVSLAELDSAVRDLLKLDGQMDCRTPILRAFNATKNMSKEAGAGADYLELREFRVFLHHLWLYFELAVLLGATQPNQERHVSIEDISAVISQLTAWGLSISDVDAAFKVIDNEHQGSVPFHDFAEWAVSSNSAFAELRIIAPQALASSPAPEGKHSVARSASSPSRGSPKSNSGTRAQQRLSPRFR